MSSRYGLEIRAAASTDAPGLSQLLAAADHIIDPRILAEQVNALRHEPGAVLIALDWGPPSGLIVLHWYRTLYALQPTAQITTLLVSPDKRRRGIGRLLVKAAAQAARVGGCGALELLAPPEQPALHAFCWASGFVDAGPRFVRALRRKG